MTPPPDPLLGKEFGHCQIQRKLGQGGMGAVYLGHHKGLNKSVAIKLLQPAMASSQEFITRFLREARLAARLEHPNVVQVFDVGDEQGIYYISMQYVEGCSLDQALKEKKKLSVSDALSLTKRVAVALSAAAKLGIVHRDIKPHNILISKDGIVKVADFGLAKDNDANRTMSDPGQIIGTPYYMSPEQAQGDPVDHRGDIYSLGATLYHMLTGKRVFEGNTPINVVLKQINEAPVRARQLEPSLPENVEALLEKMMMKDPAARYQTADELIRALDGLKTAPATVRAVAPAMPPKRKAAMIALPVAGILLVGIIVGIVLGRNGGKTPPPPLQPVAQKHISKPPMTPSEKPVETAKPVDPPKPVQPPKPPADPPKPVEPPRPIDPPKPDPPKPVEPIEAPKQTVPALVKPPDVPPKPVEPRERILGKVRDLQERKLTEEVLARSDEFFKAVQRKDFKTIKPMLDTLAYGDLSEAQILELYAKVMADKVTIEAYEIQDVDIKQRIGFRPQPHATVMVAYTLKAASLEMKVSDQPLHMLKRPDGKWYITRAPRQPGK